MQRAYYWDSIADFLDRAPTDILGCLGQKSEFAVESTQHDAWLEEIHILKRVLDSYRSEGRIYFEYSIPRLGKRIDVVVEVLPMRWTNLGQS